MLIRCSKKNDPNNAIVNVIQVTQVAGFFDLVVYTQLRVPDTEKTHGYQKEVT